MGEEWGEGWSEGGVKSESVETTSHTCSMPNTSSPDQPVLVDDNAGSLHAVARGHVIQNVNIRLQETIAEITLCNSFDNWWASGARQHFGLEGTAFACSSHSYVIHNDWSVWDGEAKFPLVAFDEGVLEVAMVRGGRGTRGVGHRGAHKSAVRLAIAEVEVGCGRDVTPVPGNIHGGWGKMSGCDICFWTRG